MIQLAITARDNKNLFSNYYLDNQLKNNPEWKKEEHNAAFSEIKRLYDTEKDHIPTLNEKQLEQRFFGPIFKILNHTVEVNEGTVQGEFPDYAFFPDRASLDDAHKKTGNLFYNNAIAIGEVKRWGIELDRFGKDKFERKRNPSQQIWMYLHDVAPKWGILLNGKTWRLYYKDRRRDDYYEIDLPTLLAKDYWREHYYDRKKTFPKIKGSYLLELPIRRISFTTPPDRRAALVAEAKALFSEFLGAPGSEDLDRINRIDRINTAANPVNPVHPVQTATSLSAAPDSLKILEFIGARLSAAPEESDVVHDLLAYLAERMIGMNKEKNAEIKGFLRWLEGEIGAPVEELTNKTALKEYYDYKYDFETFVKVLSKNKNKLKEGYDPTRREPKDKLEKEYNASLNKLTPLLKRIEATDGLIDQLVYKLYDLTPEEIKIVEGFNDGG